MLFERIHLRIIIWKAAFHLENCPRGDKIVAMARQELPCVHITNWVFFQGEAAKSQTYFGFTIRGRPTFVSGFSLQWPWDYPHTGPAHLHHYGEGKERILPGPGGQDACAHCRPHWVQVQAGSHQQEIWRGTFNRHPAYNLLYMYVWLDFWDFVLYLKCPCSGKSISTTHDLCYWLHLLAHTTLAHRESLINVLKLTCALYTCISPL